MSDVFSIAGKNAKSTIFGRAKTLSRIASEKIQSLLDLAKGRSRSPGYERRQMLQNDWTEASIRLEQYNQIAREKGMQLDPMQNTIMQQQQGAGRPVDSAEFNEKLKQFEQELDQKLEELQRRVDDYDERERELQRTRYHMQADLICTERQIDVLTWMKWGLSAGEMPEVPDELVRPS